MNKILEICTIMISITETLMHSHRQLTKSHYLSMKDMKELADDLQENVSDQLRECLHEIGELLHTCKTVLPFEEADYDDYDGDDEDEDEAVKDDDRTNLHPNVSPATSAEFSHILDLTDDAISREHMSRIAANTGKPKYAALMHEQSEKLWREAFRSMCKYVAMSHDDTISHLMPAQ